MGKFKDRFHLLKAGRSERIIDASKYPDAVERLKNIRDDFAADKRHLQLDIVREHKEAMQQDLAAVENGDECGNLCPSLPSWVSGMAKDVYALIERYGAKRRFQKRVLWWLAQHAKGHEAVKEWKRRRREHFEEKVFCDSRLRDREAGPPNEGCDGEPDWAGWLWGGYLGARKEVLQGVIDRPISINGWVPLELALESEPKVGFPLPLTHVLSLKERYIVLAAIHDYVFQNARGSRSDFIVTVGPDSLSPMKRQLRYAAFRQVLVNHRVPRLSEDDHHSFKYFLEDVSMHVHRRTRKDR